MGLEDPPDSELSRELEEEVVLVGGVDEDGIACPSASHDVDVVVEGPHHRLVDLASGIGVDLGAGQHLSRVPQAEVRHEASVGPGP